MTLFQITDLLEAEETDVDQDHALQREDDVQTLVIIFIEGKTVH